MGRQEADAVRVTDAAPQLAPLPKTGSASTRPAWRDSMAPYEGPTWGRGLLDVATSVVPYVALSVLMYVSLGELMYWATITLAIPTAGFLMRTFIVFHDCTHGSFLPSRRANLWVGRRAGCSSSSRSRTGATATPSITARLAISTGAAPATS
jgi:hypothetical protein